MFVFYDWPFLHMCTLQRMQPILFSLLILGQFSATVSSFMGIGPDLREKANWAVAQGPPQLRGLHEKQ